jgi:hypothetical protein
MADFAPQGLAQYEDIHSVLVCGSRTYPEDDPMVDLILCGIEDQHTSASQKAVVIEGGARGADRAAENWVKGHGPEYAWPHKQFRADWTEHGKRAGYVRNMRMLDEQPSVVVAFVDKPWEESKGTAHTIREAIKRSIPTYVVQRMQPARTGASVPGDES